MIGILLAAGFSRRFGPSDKLLQPLADGRPIALASAANLINVIPVSIAVVRPGNNELAKLLQDIGLDVVFCNDNDQSMADSLSAAIRFTSSFGTTANDGFLIALADMPYITSSTISAVASKLSNGASIVIPTYGGQRGHPVGFSAKFRNELESLHGDEGARAIIKRYPDEVEVVSTDDAGILVDIDTQADLKVKS